MAKKKTKAPTRKQLRKEFNEYVGAVIDRVREAARLTDWIIHFNIVEDDDESYHKPGFKALASTNVSTEYQEAFITFYEHLFEKFEDGEFWIVDHCIAHELSHIMTENLYEFGVKRFTDPDILHKEREILTERIARFVHQIMRGDKYLEGE